MTEEIPTLLNKCKNKIILITLRNNITLRASLRAFDSQMNMSLEEVEKTSDRKTEKLGKIVLRADNIVAISLPDEIR